MRMPERLNTSFMRGSVLALALAAVVVSPSLADTTITQEISDGTRSANLSSLEFDPLTYSNEPQLSSGTMDLTAADDTGTGLGWNVTIQSSDFVYSGLYAGSDIPAGNASVVTPGAPVALSGQDISGEFGPFAGAGGSLDTPRKVMYAAPGAGKGTYEQVLPVTLTIPAGSLVGTYTSTITVTMTAGPGT